MGNFAKLTSKGQLTIPQEIRLALRVQPGDLLSWEVTGEGRAEVRRVRPLDLAYLSAVEGTLDEWSSREDSEAYGDL